jgi:hypothetical protein
MKSRKHSLISKPAIPAPEVTYRSSFAAQAIVASAIKSRAFARHRATGVWKPDERDWVRVIRFQ